MIYSPQVKVFFYQEADGTCPVLDFLTQESAKRPLVMEHARDRIALLEERGHTLRRPHAAPLGEDLYELRWRIGRVQYRILYSFHGQGEAVLLHALTKEGAVPRSDLIRAQRRKKLFEENPRVHTKP